MKQDQKRHSGTTAKKKGFQKWLLWLLMIIAVSLIGLVIYNNYIAGPNLPSGEITTETQSIGYKSYRFVKNGELEIIKADKSDTLRLDIEISKLNRDRQLGLMFRDGLTDQRGMLFIFEEFQLQTFWMKNTVASLDILFLDTNLVITTINRDTKPFSEASIYSNGRALYALEVRAGYSKEYGVSIGDRIVWSWLPESKPMR